MRSNIFIQKLRSLPSHYVEIKKIRTPFGEPFNEDNHWVKTLREFEKGIKKYNESSLYKFHQNFKPVNIQGVISEYKQNKDNKILKNDIPFNLGKYPWGKWTSREGASEWKLSSHCGPSEDALIEKEWTNFLLLYKKIQQEGFRYFKYGRPLGIFFVDRMRCKYFIMLGGNHRTAIAYVMGMRYLKVRLLPREYIESQVVQYNDIVDNPESQILFENILSEDFVNWDF